ncbi:MAG: ABC transporter ATP-binding protein [Candidatus Edwardsbacteria bacterium]
MKNIKKIIKLLRVYQGHFFFVVFLSLVVTLVTYVEPMLVKYLIDSILLSKKFRLLWQFVLLIIAINLILISVRYIYQVANLKLGLQLVEQKRIEIFNKVLRFPLPLIPKVEVGDLIYRLNNDAHSLTALVGRIVFVGINSIFSIIVMSLFIFYLNWKIGLTAYLLVPVYVIFALRFNKIIHKKTQELYSYFSTVTEFLRESLSFLAPIRKMAYEKIIAQLNRNHVKKLIDIGRTVRTSGIKATSVSASFTAVGHLLILGYGSYLMLHGELTLGALVALFSYVSMFFGPIQNLIDSSIELNQMLVSLDRLEEILEMDEERESREIVEISEGTIGFKDVQFGYSEENQILSFLNVEFRRGDINVILGKSGIGKTTLLNLLLGYSDRYQGSVTIDKKPLKSHSLSALRQEIGLVEQDVFLLNNTIRFNLTMGLPISEEQIISVCKEVNLWEFINELPNGLEYVIGPQGCYLSGGQKQRLAIARALLRSAQILLLDEPTANLDLLSKKSLFTLLDNLKEQLTIIVVTHDFEFVEQRNDNIFVLGDGKIMAAGRFKDLQAKSNIRQWL